ncbi:hypothetical protein IFVP408_C290306 [Vibrio parahaemolyticus]
MLSDTGESATPYMPNRFETIESGTSSAVAHNKKGYHRTMMTLIRDGPLTKSTST